MNTKNSTTQLTNDEIIAIGVRVNGIEPSDDGGYFLPITFAREIEREIATRSPASPQAGVPDGWKLVPVMPTMEMIRAGSAHVAQSAEALEDESHDSPLREAIVNGAALCIYADILAAAPQPPAATEVGEKLEDLLPASIPEGGKRYSPDFVNGWNTCRNWAIAYLKDAAPTSSRAQAAGVDWLPEGWRVSRPAPWSALTKEAQYTGRIVVERIEAPFCGKNGLRIWTGPTVLAAFKQACGDLDLPVPAALAATPSEQPTAWRCFHCSETFTNVSAASAHFGTHQRHSPACQIDAAEYRAMEARMEAYNEEDAEIHRQMHAQSVSHQQALRRAEEDGYAKGLAACATQSEQPEGPESWRIEMQDGGSGSWPIGVMDRDNDLIARFSYMHDAKRFVALDATPSEAAPAGRDEPSALLKWAVERWHDEVAQRPLSNKHRRTLDDTWRQVILYAGGDPVSLVGPSHDDLLAAQPTKDE